MDVVNATLPDHGEEIDNRRAAPSRVLSSPPRASASWRAWSQPQVAASANERSSQ
jgi:hypothetical protein